MSDYHFQRSRSASKNERFFRITAGNFPKLEGLALQDLDMAPGERRDAHFHPNAVQMDYCISGGGEVGIIGPEGNAEVIALQPGDAAFIPRGWVHWIENTSKTPSRFILIAGHESPETIEVAEAFAALPADHKRSAT